MGYVAWVDQAASDWMFLAFIKANVLVLFKHCAESTVECRASFAAAKMEMAQRNHETANSV